MEAATKVIVQCQYEENMTAAAVNTTDGARRALEGTLQVTR